MTESENEEDPVDNSAEADKREEEVTNGGAVSSSQNGDPKTRKKNPKKWRPLSFSISHESQGDAAADEAEAEDDEEEEDFYYKRNSNSHVLTAAAAATNRTKPNKREKFDSGLGDDEEVEDDQEDDQKDDQKDDQEDDQANDQETQEGVRKRNGRSFFGIPGFVMGVANNDDEAERRNKRCLNKPRTEMRIGGKWRRVAPASNTSEYSSNNSSSTGSDPETAATAEEDRERHSGGSGESSGGSGTHELRMVASPYTEHMRNRIQVLPIPVILKNYLNFYREF